MHRKETVVAAGRHAIAFIEEQLAEIQAADVATLGDRSRLQEAYLALRPYGAALLALSEDWDNVSAFRAPLHDDMIEESLTHHTDEELRQLAELARAMSIMSFDSSDYGIEAEPEPQPLDPLAPAA